jgi:hypothetical protein
VPLGRDGGCEWWESCGRDLASAEILKKIAYHVLGLPVSKWRIEPETSRIETGSASSSDASVEVGSLLAISLRNFVRNDGKRTPTMVILAFAHYWALFIGKLPGLLGGWCGAHEMFVFTSML